MATSNAPRTRVRSYVRSDGTRVRGHLRKRPGHASTPPASSNSGDVATFVAVLLFLLLLYAASQMT